jgi:hypothetical protein
VRTPQQWLDVGSVQPERDGRAAADPLVRRNGLQPRRNDNRVRVDGNGAAGDVLCETAFAFANGEFMLAQNCRRATRRLPCASAAAESARSVCRVDRL